MRPAADAPTAAGRDRVCAAPHPAACSLDRMPAPAGSDSPLEKFRPRAAVLHMRIVVAFQLASTPTSANSSTNDARHMTEIGRIPQAMAKPFEQKPMRAGFIVGQRNGPGHQPRDRLKRVAGKTARSSLAQAIVLRAWPATGRTRLAWQKTVTLLRMRVAIHEPEK